MSKKTIAFGFIALLILNIYFAYTYGSSSVKEPSSSESFINGLTFADLPKEVQNEYISKKDLESLERLGLVSQTNTKELFITTDEPLSDNIDELKEQIVTLREKNNFLYQDNIDLSNKNWDLALKLNSEQKNIEDERQKLTTGHLEAMNLVEEQHYQNINDLTKRINYLQEESMNKARKYENKIIELENSIRDLERSLREEKSIKNEKIAAATKEQRVSNSTLAEKNRYLLDQVKVLENRLFDELNEKDKFLQSLKDEIKRLNLQIEEKESQYSLALAKHTKEILDLEKKQNEIISKNFEASNEEKRDLLSEVNRKNEELEASLIRFNEEKKALKEQIVNLEEEVVKKEYIKKREHEELIKENSKKDQKLAQLEQLILNLQNELKNEQESMNKRLKQKQDEYLATLDEIRKNSIENNQLKNLKEANEELKKSQIALDEKEGELEKLKSELEELKKEKDRSLAKNESKHLENYDLLNSKIVKLEQEKNSILKQLTKLNENSVSSEIKVNLEGKIEVLEEKLKKTNDENNSLKLSQNEQLAKLKDEFLTLSNSYKEQERDYEDKISKLNELLLIEQDEKEKLSQNSFENELLGSVTCDDMKSGVNSPTNECKEEVLKFLNTHKNSKIFEIVAIIDGGGFAALKKASTSNIGIEDSEIKRLTRLSNIGLSKDRVNSAKELLDEVIDKKQIVSFPSEIIETKNKRGFVIRAYK